MNRNTIAILVLILLSLAGGIWIGKQGIPGLDSKSKQHVHAETSLYVCPMHPQIVREEPGTCPICAMDLVPKETSEQKTETTNDGVIQIPAHQVQQIGVRTFVAGESEWTHLLSLNGSVQLNPQDVAVVNARTMGWIQGVPRFPEGSWVGKGEQLARFYSPDLVAAQEDYLQAFSIKDSSLQVNVRKRLEILGFPGSLVDSLQKSGNPMREVPILSPIQGVVLERSILQGQNVMPGMDLYRIGNLATLWILAKVYPGDIASIRIGQGVQVKSRSLGSKELRGTVQSILPSTDPMDQSTMVRIEAGNTPRHDLRPGMQAIVELALPRGKGVVVPREAVIRTGARSLVILALGDGAFQPRKVEVGIAMGDSLQILDGLWAGEEIVTSAQFLIDSESQLQKSLDAFSK